MVEVVREMQRLREVVARMGGESEGEVSEELLLNKAKCVYSRYNNC